MTTWTRVSDPDTAVTLLPAWFTARMMATRGSYGFLLTTGDVVRVSRITSIHLSSSGTILIDVLLDRAGLPDAVDAAWQSKHFLGAPVVGAPLATLNLAQIAIAVEFVAAAIVEGPAKGEDVPVVVNLPLVSGAHDAEDTSDDALGADELGQVMKPEVLSR